MKSNTFDRFAGISAIFAGITILLYAIAFVVIARSAPELGGKLSALFLLLNGLLITPPLVALYVRFQDTDGPIALLALLLGMAGSFGAAIHGGYDLANAINPPTGITPEIAAALATLPNQVDPRGLLTFGVSGIALFIFARLMAQGSGFPSALRYLGFVLAVLLCWLYLGRLIILDPTSVLLIVPILLTGFVVNPIWYLWLGIVLQRRANTSMQVGRSTRLGMSTKG